MSLLPSSPIAGPAAGSKDSDRAADHDQPYRFGFRRRTSAPYPFNTRQYARLLVLRGRVTDDTGMISDLDRRGDATASLQPAV